MSSIFIEQHEAISFISLEELQQTALLLTDILPKDPNIDTDDIQFPEIEDLPSNPNELLELLPPSAEPIIRQGYSAPTIVIQKPFELHYAAQKGDMNTIKRLVEQQHYDVNKEDVASTRPLYVASVFGHIEAVKYFIAKGADVNDFCFDSDTALHAALENKHYAIARALVEQGGANIHLINKENQSATTALVNHYISLYEKSTAEIKKPETIKEILEIIQTLDVFSHHCGDHFLYSFPLEGTKSVDIPVGYFLKNFATKAPTIEVRDKLLALADDLATFDPSEQIYDSAKNLLNTFPNREMYPLKYSEEAKTLFFGSGHFGHSTTKWAAQSISAFYEHLKLSCYDQQKLTVFSKLTQTFAAATELKSNGEIESYAQAAHDRFENGETILLGSGWNTHFIDVVLSKNQELFITGNSGLRCNQFSPGLNFYHMNDTSIIKSGFMHDMTVNMSRTFFERDIMYKYELIEKVGESVKPLQVFDNCTWVGHQHGAEACLYIELLNLGIKDNAKALAKQYYHEWEAFHGNYQIDHYMKNNPGLPVQAMVDIFKGLAKNASHDTVKKAHAQKICDALTSDHYGPEFKSWYKQAGNETKKLFEPYHVSEKLSALGYHDHETGNAVTWFKKLIFGDTTKTTLKPLHQAEADHSQDSAHVDTQDVHVHNPAQLAPDLVHHEITLM